LSAVIPSIKSRVQKRLAAVKAANK
jgi:hypothetical protein